MQMILVKVITILIIVGARNNSIDHNASWHNEEVDCYFFPWQADIITWWQVTLAQSRYFLALQIIAPNSYLVCMLL
jgi:hypothetical protein